MYNPKVLALFFAVQLGLVLLYRQWVPDPVAVWLVALTDLALLVLGAVLLAIDVALERRARARRDPMAEYAKSADAEIGATAKLLRAAREELAGHLAEVRAEYEADDKRRAGWRRFFTYPSEPGWEVAGFVFVVSKESYYFLKRTRTTDPDVGVPVEHTRTLGYTWRERRDSPHITLTITGDGRPRLRNSANGRFYPGTPEGWCTMMSDRHRPKPEDQPQR